MKDLSLHILDISENSILAGATLIEVTIREDTKKNLLRITIKDNGRGMNSEETTRVQDPFFTTKTEKVVGLGIPLLAQAAREAGGRLNIHSQKGRGTTVRVDFVHDHIDRKPLGNLVETILVLITGQGITVDLVYKHIVNSKRYVLDTREVKKTLRGVAIDNPEVIYFLKKSVEEGLKYIRKGEHEA